MVQLVTKLDPEDWRTCKAVLDKPKWSTALSEAKAEAVQRGATKDNELEKIEQLMLAFCLGKTELTNAYHILHKRSNVISAYKGLYKHDPVLVMFAAGVLEKF